MKRTNGMDFQVFESTWMASNLCGAPTLTGCGSPLPGKRNDRRLDSIILWTTTVNSFVCVNHLLTTSTSTHSLSLLKLGETDTVATETAGSVAVDGLSLRLPELYHLYHLMTLLQKRPELYQLMKPLLSLQDLYQP